MRDAVLDERRHQQDAENPEHGGADVGFGAGGLSCTGVPYKVRFVRAQPTKAQRRLLSQSKRRGAGT